MGQYGYAQAYLENKDEIEAAGGLAEQVRLFKQREAICRLSEQVDDSVENSEEDDVRDTVE